MHIKCVIDHINPNFEITVYNWSKFKVYILITL